MSRIGKKPIAVPSGVKVEIDGCTVAIEDIQHLALPALRHRILTSFHAEAEGVSSDDIIKQLLAETPDTKR